MRRQIFRAVFLAMAPGLLGAGTMAIAAPIEQGTPLAVGSSAWVAGTQGAGLRVHTAPLLNSDVLGSLSEAAPVLVLEGPVASGGSGWYRVSSVTLPRSGWVDGQYLSSAPPGPPSASIRLVIGGSAWVSGTGGAGLQVHTAPLLQSQVIETLGEGAPVHVLEGPVAADGTSWYRVSSPALSGSGWVAGQFLATPPPGPPATTGPAVGSNAWVTGTGGAGLRVHAAPLLSSPQTGSLPDGTPVQVLEGPVAGDGYNWYRVASGTLPSPGWVVGGALTTTSP